MGWMWTLRRLALFWSTPTSEPSSMFAPSRLSRHTPSSSCCSCCQRWTARCVHSRHPHATLHIPLGLRGFMVYGLSACNKCSKHVECRQHCCLLFPWSHVSWWKLVLNDKNIFHLFSSGSLLPNTFAFALRSALISAACSVLILVKTDMTDLHMLT